MMQELLLMTTYSPGQVSLIFHFANQYVLFPLLYCSNLFFIYAVHLSKIFRIVFIFILGGVDVDPARQVLVMDDAHFAKILHVDEPGKMALLPTPLPRPWCSVYPNARLQSPLIVSADWTGNVSVVTWRSENDLKKSLFSHTIIQWVLSNSATRVFRGITGSPSNVGSIQNSSQISGVGPTGQQNISSEDLPVGFTAISWHPLPIGLFAVVSSTGLLYLHSL